jgi:hypothetical protein
MNIEEVELGVDWIDKAQDKWRVILNAVTNLLVPQEVFDWLRNC